jgi:hypothetical protein
MMEVRLSKAELAVGCSTGVELSCWLVADDTSFRVAVELWIGAEVAGTLVAEIGRSVTVELTSGAAVELGCPKVDSDVALPF